MRLTDTFEVKSEIVKWIDQFERGQLSFGDLSSKIQQKLKANSKAQADLTRKEIADYMFKLETLKQFHELRLALKFGNFEALKQLGSKGE